MGSGRDEDQHASDIDHVRLLHEAVCNDENMSAGSKPMLLFLRKTLPLLLALSLLICNILLYRQNRRLMTAADDRGFTGIYSLGEGWKQFRTYSEYSDANETLSNSAWLSFNTNGFVAIPHDEAANSGLPVAQDFPDDPTKGVYVLGGFHQIHCVIYLRNTIQDLRVGISVDDKLAHINHCYDALRQFVQCQADDTPFYTPYRSKLTGDGQFRRCRDWNALTAWAQKHTACWPTGHCADLENLEKEEQNVKLVN